MDKTGNPTDNEKLDQEAIDERLASLGEWTQTGEALQRTLGFPDFRNAMAFVDHVADLAEDDQHHPDILIRYSKVTLTLTTHDAGGITDRDFDLARKIDGIAGE